MRKRQSTSFQTLPARGVHVKLQNPIHICLYLAAQIAVECGTIGPESNCAYLPSRFLNGPGRCSSRRGTL